MAAPGGWRDLPVASATMPLADPALAPNGQLASGPDIQSPGGMAETGISQAASSAVDLVLATRPDPGPAARSFAFAGDGIDRMRAQQCLAMAIYYEAASESLDGQRAVAQVVLNRVAHPGFPASVCGVVFQGSERRTGCQFTFTCDGSLARRPSILGLARANMVARAALEGEIYRPVGLATHYHTLAVSPYWAPSLNPVTVIGAHIFYRWRGAAGQAQAFTVAYRGGEPVAAPRPRLEPDVGVADPVTFARAFEQARGSALQGLGLSPPPAATHSPIPSADLPPSEKALAHAEGPGLPSGGAIRPEYARAGQWIAQPR